MSEMVLAKFLFTVTVAGFAGLTILSGVGALVRAGISPQPGDELRKAGFAAGLLSLFGYAFVVAYAF